MILSKLIKPKWQHHDASARQLALEDLNDSEIINQMAQSDEAIEVRKIAIRKVNNLELLNQIAQQDENNKVQEFAKQRFKQLLCCQKEDCPPLELRLDWIRKITDSSLINYIVQYGVETELRLLALAKVEREGLVGDIAINDVNIDVRLAAVEKLTQKSTLERVWKASRNNNKKVSRSAHEKLDKIIEKLERPTKVLNEKKAIFAKFDAFKRRLTAENSPLNPNQAAKNGRKVLEREQVELQRLKERWEQIVTDIVIADQTAFNELEQSLSKIFTQYEQGLELEKTLAPIRIIKQTICEKLDKTLIALKKHQRINHEDRQLFDQQLAELQAEWENSSELNTDEEKQWQSRFQRIVQSIQQRYKKLQSHDKTAAQLESVCAQLDNLLANQETIKSDSIQHFESRWERVQRPHDSQSLSLFSELDNKFKQHIGKLQVVLKSQKETSSKAIKQIKPLLTDLETVLEKGELKSALSLEKQVRQLFDGIQLSTTTDSYNSLEKRLQHCVGEINKLRSWQNWGNEVERETLCQQVEALLETDESPENVLKQTEQAQNTWKKLGSSGYSHADREKFNAIRDRFNQACQKVYRLYREYLCVKVENLSTDLTAIDPEEMAHIIRELQATWKDLGALGHSQEFWERFSKACQVAYEPCRTHFNIKAQEREQNFCEKQSLCKSLEQFVETTNWEQANWKEVYHFVRETEKNWHNIGPTDRKHKKTIQKQFQVVMQIVDNNLDQERERNCHHRVSIMLQVTKIVQQLQAEIEEIKQVETEQNFQQAAERKTNKAIDEVKKLQRDWEVTVPNSRQIEREFWNEFRGTCDIVFDYRKQQQETHKKELQSYTDERVSICEQIETLANSETGDLITQLKVFKHEWREVKKKWEHINTEKGGRRKSKKNDVIEVRFDKSCRQVEKQHKSYLLQERRKELDLLKQKAALCIEVEINNEVPVESDWQEVIQAKWLALSKLQNQDLETAIEQRFQQAQQKLLANEKSVNLAGLKEKETLCVRMEILAGIESPAEATKARLAYQVARLNAAINDGQKEVKRPQQKVEEMEQLWYLTSIGVGNDKTANLEQRFELAGQAFYAL